MKHRMALVAVAALFVCGSSARAQSADTPAADAAMTRPGVSGVIAMTIPMTGESEVPGPGDPDGTGEAFLIVHPDGGKVCYALSMAGTQPPTAAHIHEGSIDESGGPVVPLPAAQDLAGCVTATNEVLQRISAKPGDFYVNVHTEEFPQGAVRGQLTD